MAPSSSDASLQSPRAADTAGNAPATACTSTAATAASISQQSSSTTVSVAPFLSIDFMTPSRQVPRQQTSIGGPPPSQAPPPPTTAADSSGWGGRKVNRFQAIGRSLMAMGIMGSREHGGIGAMLAAAAAGGGGSMGKSSRKAQRFESVERCSGSSSSRTDGADATVSPAAASGNRKIHRFESVVLQRSHEQAANLASAAAATDQTINDLEALIRSLKSAPALMRLAPPPPIPLSHPAEGLCRAVSEPVAAAGSPRKMQCKSRYMEVHECTAGGTSRTAAESRGTRRIIGTLLRRQQQEDPAEGNQVGSQGRRLNTTPPKVYPGMMEPPPSRLLSDAASGSAVSDSSAMPGSAKTMQDPAAGSLSGFSRAFPTGAMPLTPRQQEAAPSRGFIMEGGTSASSSPFSLKANARQRFDFPHAAPAAAAMMAVPPSSAGQALAAAREVPELPVRRAFSTAELVSQAGILALGSPRSKQLLSNSYDKPSSSFFFGAFTALSSTLSSKSMEAAKVANRQEDRRSSLEAPRQVGSSSLLLLAASPMPQGISPRLQQHSSILASAAATASVGSQRHQLLSASSAAVGSPRQRSSFSQSMASPRPSNPKLHGGMILGVG